jgi:hypothetical protein
MSDQTGMQRARVYGTDPLYTVSDRGQQHGPYSEGQLVGMLAVGQVSRDAYVFADGWDQWFPVASALAAASAAAQSPPATATTIAVQAEYAQTNVTQTHYVQTNYVHTNHYHSPTGRKRAKSNNGLVGLGAMLMLIGLLGCWIPLVGILFFVGLVVMLVGFITGK